MAITTKPSVLTPRRDERQGVKASGGRTKKATVDIALALDT